MTLEFAAVVSNTVYFLCGLIDYDRRNGISVIENKLIIIVCFAGFKILQGILHEGILGKVCRCYHQEAVIVIILCQFSQCCLWNRELSDRYSVFRGHVKTLSLKHLVNSAYFVFFTLRRSHALTIKVIYA